MEFGEPSEAKRETMRRMFENFDTVEDVERVAALYVFDTSYARGDIAFCIKERSIQIRKAARGEGEE